MKSMQPNQANLNALDNVVAKLGLEGAIEMFEFSLPIIIKRKQVLSEYLANREMDKATAYAHQTIASIRLYGSPELEALLRRIKTMDEKTDVAAFILKLQHEFDQAITTIEYWLSSRS